jgi:hypothetical protein
VFYLGSVHRCICTPSPRARLPALRRDAQPIQPTVIVACRASRSAKGENRTPANRLTLRKHRQGGVRLLVRYSISREGLTDDVTMEIRPNHGTSNTPYNSLACCCMTICRAWVICFWYWGM